MRDLQPGVVSRGIVGAFIGLVVGAIVSVNVVIFAGIEDGYEATITEVFSENALVAIAAILLLAAGPIIGVLIALRERPHS
ncbi:MAG: hypothetical protein HKN74_00110 [Acidimicrobiia bacterium]|nr:hypothetical protein [Acidimicrobiia bacterium]MBT8217250.1 hypothetical protein [Acidimicrobiia bacterium]NNF08673.1 hypothetical protein [Acidimicrobiia bacterium]NNL70627.1 hypothetical protein [Acidimicrobiia bacterium]